MIRNQSQIKIVVVDDHKLFRKGLIKLINSINDKRYFILFEAENGNDLIAKLDRKALPDVVIMDIEMPSFDGFQTVSWLRTHFPDIKVLVLTMKDSDSALIRMLKLGVKGFLSKDIEPEDLGAALSAITSKGYYYTEALTGKLIHSIQSEQLTNEENEAPGRNLLFSLSEREREFLKYVCTELKYDEIAALMHLSTKTIDNYREALFKKFNVKNRIGLVVYVIKNRIIDI